MTNYKGHPRFKVAAIQAGSIFRNAPKWFDLEATLEKGVDLIEEAGRAGARLVVFPECFLPCYPYWSLDLSDKKGFRELWANFLWSSIEVPSRETEALCEAAKRADVYVVMGINERDREFTGRMYNSILFVSPFGEIVGIHRKICNTVQERFFHTAGDGGENLKTVFKTEIGRIGGSICGEHQQLALLYNWVLQGIQIHCSLWPGNLGLENYVDLTTRSFCRIGKAFGVLSAAYIPKKDMPSRFYKNCSFNLANALRGGSGIIHPSGEYIAGPVYDEETIIYAEVDLSDIDRSRCETDLTGLYNRWDLLNLNIRQEPYVPNVAMEDLNRRVSSVSNANSMEELKARIIKLEQQVSRLLQSETKKKENEI